MGLLGSVQKSVDSAVGYYASEHSTVRPYRLAVTTYIGQQLGSSGIFGSFADLRTCTSFGVIRPLARSADAVISEFDSPGCRMTDVLAACV